MMRSAEVFLASKILHQLTFLVSSLGFLLWLCYRLSKEEDPWLILSVVYCFLLSLLLKVKTTAATIIILEKSLSEVS